MKRKPVIIKSILLIMAVILLCINCKKNKPPDTPSTPSGPSSGKVDTLYYFSSFATDPEEDSVAIRFEWGDGDTSEWSSFVSSEENVAIEHSYSSGALYNIRSQAKDTKGAISNWSEA